jgi:gamma-glutamyl-gamma-aminobutyrate hydrolase PuuD
MKIALSKRTIERQGKIYDAIENAWYQYLDGHELTFIPNRLDQDFDSIADSVDCFIVTGGDNRLIRRKTERRMVIAMMKRNKPVVGICHGAFLLTKFLGGTTGRKEGHRDGEHAVIYNGQEHMVNSFHRFHIDTLPSSAQILAVDPDGDCEAWLDHNIAGIVWHPERMETGWVPPEIGILFGKTNT